MFRDAFATAVSAFRHSSLWRATAMHELDCLCVRSGVRVRVRVVCATGVRCNSMKDEIPGQLEEMHALLSAK